MTQRYLKFLKIVTHSVGSIDIATSAWTDWLGYRLVAEGRLDARLCARPETIRTLPYDGRRTAVIQGPAGEWLELIEGL